MSDRLYFENTEIAFAAKSDKDLKRAHFIFYFIRYQWLTNFFSSIITFLLKWKAPVEGLIRNTLFPQFVGGAHLQATKPVSKHLYQFKVLTVLDYGAEGGAANEAVKDAHAEEFISAIETASSSNSTPFISIKITAIASVGLMEKIHLLMQSESGWLSDRYKSAVQQLDEDDAAEWSLVEKRLHKIAGIASIYKIRVLVDAEESWIQDAVDGLISLLLPYYNHIQAILYYSVQLYRKGRLDFLKQLHHYASAHQLILGVKLVRGAYMEKERQRALQENYPSPIQDNKQAVDQAFDAALVYCAENATQIAAVVATHNEFSCLHAVELMAKYQIDSSNTNFHFCQLFGMGDHITFTLAKEGYSVSKYIPYGPVGKVIPYLLRRAQENTSVKGQGSREYDLICKELKRRGL